MNAPAQSFAVAGEAPEKVARAVAQAARVVNRPTGAIVFCAGALGARLADVAAAIAKADLRIPVCLAAGAGVVSERGEVEGVSAASGIVWSGGTTEAFAADAASTEQIGSALATQIARRTRSEPATALVFARPSGLSPHVLEPLAELRNTRVFGAGTIGEASVITIQASGEVRAGAAGGIVLTRMASPVVGASTACRLLMPLRIISKTRGAMVLEIEGEPALEVLSSVAEGLVDQPLVFVALAASEPGAEKRELLVRAVQGVDPVRRGLVISDEVRPGLRLAFAVRDARAAREGLETMVRDLERDVNGAAPRFGIYLNCAGRGSGLYGARDVDLKIVRSRFGKLPIAGMQSSFEVAEVAGRPALQLYTGVLGVFSAPS